MSLPHSVGRNYPLTGLMPSQLQPVAKRISRTLRGGQPVYFGGGDEVVLQKTPQLQPVENDDLHWQKLKQVQAQAQKARQYYPNFSNRHYGALVVLDNGVEGMGTNTEASPQATFCDLRYAIANAMSQSIATQSPANTPPKVKTIYLVNSDLEQDPAPIPCSDCQEWLASRLCAPDTQVVSLEKDNANKASLRIRRVKDILPIHAGRPATRFSTERKLSDLPVEITEAAKPAWKAMGGEYKASKQIQALLKEAKQAFLEQSSQHSKKADFQAGAAVLLEPSGLIRRAGRFAWSSRWFEPADLRAASAALEAVSRQQATIHKLPAFIQAFLKSRLEPPKIQAVAYYGRDTQLPPIASLGRMVRQYGSVGTLLVTVENDVIQVRTIRDVMPEMYRSGS